MEEHNLQTNSKIETLVTQVGQLTKATEDLRVGIGELMKFVHKEKDDSVVIQGKEQQTPTYIGMHTITHNEEQGSVHQIITPSVPDVPHVAHPAVKGSMNVPPGWVYTQTPPPFIPQNVVNQPISVPPVTQNLTKHSPYVTHTGLYPQGQMFYQPNHLIPQSPYQLNGHPTTQNQNPTQGQPIPQMSWYPTNDTGQSKITPGFGPLRIPKLDFPRFDGKDPRGWVNKCEKFFMINPYLDSKTKVIFSTLHCEGEADIWVQTVFNEQPGMLWEQFVELVYHRFSKVGYENIVGQFNKLVQKGKVEEYIN